MVIISTCPRIVVLQQVKKIARYRRKRVKINSGSKLAMLGKYVV
jgi:hypothetical protein